ncbi:HupE/UreJ family protein [Thermodesulfobacteriota bacterium]
MKNIILSFLIIILSPSISNAHILQGDGGFLSGLTHPVLGFDHFLAMLSVGILSAQMGGRAIWTVPATFVSVMAVGALLGIKGINIPGVEYGIALSVLVLGFSLAMEKKLLPIWAMLCVGCFAIFHGHAHGTEMPRIVQPIVYSLGFLLGTASIHICGVLIGVFSGRTVRGAEILRFVGAGISGVGVHIIYILTKYNI